MSDALDTLPDAALSEVFAVEVAGWTEIRYEEGENVDIEGRCIYPWSGIRGRNSKGERDFIPHFATSTDAVLPYLEKHNEVFVEFFAATKLWQVLIVGKDRGVSTTFARAAGLALIQAKRAEKRSRP